jgi:hypothetical protein
MPQVLGEAMADVMAPVLLTSLTNFFMFLVMARSDLSGASFCQSQPAFERACLASFSHAKSHFDAGIYTTAYVAMIAVAMLWLLMVTTFPALMAIDLNRQAANRGEICCLCATGPAPGEVHF